MIKNHTGIHVPFGAMSQIHRIKNNCVISEWADRRSGSAFDRLLNHRSEHAPQKPRLQPLYFKQRLSDEDAAIMEKAKKMKVDNIITEVDINSMSGKVTVKRNNKWTSFHRMEEVEDYCRNAQNEGPNENEEEENNAIFHVSGEF